MPRSTPATQVIPDEGLAANMTQPDALGDIVDCGGNEVLTVENGSGGSITVTLVTPSAPYGLALADRAVTVAAGTTKDIPLRRYYRQPADAGEGPGKCLVNYSAVADVTRAVKRVS